MFLLITICTIVLHLGYLWYEIKNNVFTNPVFYVLSFQLISFIGSLYYIDYRYEVDVVYYFIIVLGMYSTVFGFIVGEFLFPMNKRGITEWTKKSFIIEKGIIYDNLVYILILLSTLIALVYYYSVGYNVFLLGIINLVSTGTVVEDVSALRLASYNSEVTGKYFYPGYVNQFKNTLLPLCLLYLWSKIILVKHVNYRVSKKLLLILFSILATIFILGTGQRGAFVLFMIISGAFLMTILPKKKKRTVLLFGLLFILTFLILSTYLIGRAGTEGFELSAALEAIWSRIIRANQRGAIIGFREIIYKEPFQYGMEWWQSVKGLLPGVKGSNLSNRVAKIMWGGYGTAPPSSWGSIYYNFGWFGIFFIPIIISIGLKYLFSRLYNKKKCVFRVLIYLYVFVLLGTWIAGNPISYLFNTGLVAVIILKLIFSTTELFIGKNTTIVNLKNVIRTG